MSFLKSFFLIIAVLVVILGGIFVINVFSYWREIKKIAPPSHYIQHQLEGQVGAGQANINKQEQLNTTLFTGNNAPFIGSATPLLTIVGFCDFECPMCEKAYPIIREFVAQHSSEVRLVFRHYVNSIDHPNSETAALASECAKDQEKFWFMHDKLFQNQDKLDMASIIQYARQIGLDEIRFSACMASRSPLAHINQDLSDAVSLEVQGTPTWFVNGQKVPGVVPAQGWEEMLRIVKGAQSPGQ